MEVYKIAILPNFNAQANLTSIGASQFFFSRWNSVVWYFKTPLYIFSCLQIKINNAIGDVAATKKYPRPTCFKVNVVQIPDDVGTKCK